MARHRLGHETWHEFPTIGDLLYQSGRSKEAITFSNQALTLDSMAAIAYNNRGYAKRKLGAYEAVIVDFPACLDAQALSDNRQGKSGRVEKGST